MLHYRQVRDAIANGIPVVALESTIISHGMPYPRNLEMAKEVEATVRRAGAVPATIAIIDGVPKAGLDENDLLKLASNHNNSVLKASTRDIAHACATGAMAATTVASTMKLAHLAGISVFATGGIGGVHRGVESTMDISADLLELSRTPVTVVCAGIKSILDIPRSLEVLETNSVPVLSYQTSVFPAFYTNESGIPSPRSVENAGAVASIMAYQRLLQLQSGILVAVPNPAPANAEKIQYAIDFALLSAHNEGITGAKVTPYVLDKIQKLTSGESLDSNIALVLNNARIAAEIAVDYANLLGKDAHVLSQHMRSFGGDLRFSKEFHSVAPVADWGSRTTATTPVSSPSTISPPVGAGSVDESKPVKEVSTSKGTASHDSHSTAKAAAASTPPSTPPALQTSRAPQASATPEILVVGGAVVDLVGRISTMTKFHTSNPGKLTISHGGVGRNIAESLARLGRNVSLATAVADDLNGRSLLEGSQQKGIDMSCVRVLPSEPSSAEAGSDKKAGAATHSTAIYNAIHDSTGDLSIGIADMEIFSQIDGTYIQSLSTKIASAKVVAVDGNISKEAFAVLAAVCAQHNVPIFFEPTSDHKCLLPFQAGCMDKVGCLSLCGLHIALIYLLNPNFRAFVQVDMLKPNISELVQMVSHCLNNGYINSGRALVSNTLAAIAGNRIDQGNMQHMDLSDVRILLNALYQAMNSQPGAHSSDKKYSLLGSLLKSEPAEKNKASTKETGAVSSASAGTRAITGKHILVSLGSRGVVWCGPAKLLSAVPASDAAYLKDGSLVVNEATQSATLCIPAVAVDPAAMVHTNGAGDALCAGLLAEIVRKQSEGGASGVTATATAGLPDIECIRGGLLNAHRWLISK